VEDGVIDKPCETQPGPKQRRINELENALYRVDNKQLNYRAALLKIRDFPKGWDRNLSITDFIDGVLQGKWERP
jgi:hypothetical protein